MELDALSARTFSRLHHRSWKKLTLFDETQVRCRIGMEDAEGVRPAQTLPIAPDGFELSDMSGDKIASGTQAGCPFPEDHCVWLFAPVGKI